MKFNLSQEEKEVIKKKIPICASKIPPRQRIKALNRDLSRSLRELEADTEKLYFKRKMKRCPIKLETKIRSKITIPK